MMFGKGLLTGLVAATPIFQAVLGQEYAVNAAKQSDHGIIKLTDENFEKVFELPNKRSYGVAILFTTNNMDFNCNTCVKFDPEFELISQSWLQDHPELTSNEKPDLQLVFARTTIDSPKNIPAIFRMFKLQQIPKLLYFPPGDDIEHFENIDIPQEDGVERVNYIVNWIKVLTGIPDFALHEPTDWTSLFLTAFIVFTSVYLFRKHTDLILGFINSKWIWTLGSVIFIIFMISGYMFTQMRQVPIAGSNRNGEIIYFAEGEFQNQFGIETQIVAVFYGILTCLTLFLIKIVPGFDTDATVTENNNKPNKKSKRKNSFMNSPYFSTILAVSGAVLLYSFFAAYTNIYGMKQAYPFTLFKITQLFSH
ncbi:oligosaccharyl transferase subunit ost3/OST6 [Monosporozyma unispora]|nr:oligosaccharyl transferase subunit ost3/OST6 [Kazachstania unispora]